MTRIRTRGENMPYIPEKHKKYNLLPFCRKRGGEVFEYPSNLISKAEEMLSPEESITPYGFKSYDEYFAYIDKLIIQNQNNYTLVEILEQVKVQVKEMNIKEDWSVLKYVGESDGAVFGLTHNKNYYWPTRKSKPVYCGVIDDEEFTAYLYPTESHLWEILEDPTGMAYNTIYGNGKGKMSEQEHNEIIAQVSDALNK